MYYIVKYSGPFGFIKPWTAVRDGLTFSQQFLTPSIIEGIRQKLEVSAILRHRLTYDAISQQQEQTQTRGWNYQKTKKLMSRERSILTRGVMLNPELWLAFNEYNEAERAAQQHICLCRNEDILFPGEDILELTEEEFNTIQGFELRFGQNENSFLVGFNRFEQNKPMYGWLEVTDKPLKTYVNE